MILELSYYSVTLFATTLILTILAAYVWHRRSVPGGTYFALLMAAAAEWAFMGALEYGAVDVSTEIMFARLTYIGALAIPPLWILFTLDYCNMGRWITKRRNALLWTLPVIAVAMVFTNEYHGLIWSSIVWVHTEPGDTLIYNQGIASWIINLYIAILAISGLILLARKALMGRENNKHMTAITFLGALIIVLSGIISELGQYPLKGVDLTPFAFTIIGLMVSWGIYRHRIFDLMPVATEKLIENMADGVLVLDRHGAIVKINAATQQMFDAGKAAVGQHAEKALGKWPLPARCSGDRPGQHCEITISRSDGPRWIDVTVSALQDERTGYNGTLLILRDVTERKRAEESLRKSEYDRVKAEQLGRIGYYDWDLKMLEAQVSEGCARIFGFPPGTTRITYEMLTEKFHPEDAERVKRVFHEDVWQGRSTSVECRIILPDSNVRHIRCESEAPVKDATGAYTRQFGVVQDITERKLNEESLQKSEHDRIKAERLAHLGYYYWDIEKREAHISEGCARIFEFPAGTSTITWDTFVKMIHPEDAVHMTGENVARMRRGEPHATEFRIILPDGTVRHVFEESEAVVRDATSGRTMQFGIIQDITERKRAEETVRLTEEKYRTIVETANESICIVDNQARLAFANNKAVKMLGYTQEEMVGHSAYEFIDREDHELLSKNLVTKRLDNKEQSNYRMRCKNGNLIWALSSSSPLYNDKGEIAGLLVMLTDITNLKLADEQLKASLKEKEALLKEVHHRVKNNLQIVTSLLNLQSSGIEDAKYISMIRDSQNRIKSMALVHEHLYKSSDLSNIDISEYLKSLVCNLSRSYCHPSGSVKFRTDLENIKMDIDKAVPIGIIVTELVSNSIKYAFPGNRKGEILVELHRDGEKNVLAISDNGVGLPAGFEIGKTGTLGLQLVEMLVQQIDGTLEIDRTERTTFRIIFVR